MNHQAHGCSYQETLCSLNFMFIDTVCKVTGTSGKDGDRQYFCINSNHVTYFGEKLTEVKIVT